MPVIALRLANTRKPWAANVRECTRMKKRRKVDNSHTPGFRVAGEFRMQIAAVDSRGDGG